ncbi:MAG: hypothetical protein R3C11_09610 [Planctomycetaceae bacterium]
MKSGKPLAIRLSLLTTLGCCAGFLFSQLPAAQPLSAQEQTLPTEKPHALHNLRKIAPGYFSGGEPAGKEAFEELAERGVKVIISVDGIRPDIELARQYGMRYIHIPIEYSGIDRDSELKLVKAAREVNEPVYVHCHHGKHRGPAAMAIMCRAANLFEQEDAERYLHEAGTSPEYKGLWKSVRDFTSPAEETILPPLTEVAEVNSLTSNMAEADRRFDHLVELLEQEKAKSLEPATIEKLNSELLLLWADPGISPNCNSR